MRHGYKTKIQLTKNSLIIQFGLECSNIKKNTCQAVIKVRNPVDLELKIETSKFVWPISQQLNYKRSGCSIERFASVNITAIYN